jgi:hypothetical protein
MIKTDRNSVFIGREAHIPDRLYIMVMYLKFYGFQKISNLGSKSNGVILQFCRKMSVCDKNLSRLRIY